MLDAIGAQGEKWHAVLGTVREDCRRFVLSPQFQSGIQLSAGFLACSLFVFIRPLSFDHSCLAATGHLLASAALVQDNYAGVKLQAAAQTLGGCVWGLGVGAIVLTLARPAHGAVHTLLLSLLGTLALSLLAMQRTAIAPASQGLLGTVFFGILVILGQPMQLYGDIWKLTGFLMADISIGVIMACIMACMLLPSLAVDQVHACTVRVLRGVGQATSGYASRAFRPEDPNAADSLLHQHPSLLHQLPSLTTHTAPAPAAAAAQHQQNAQQQVQQGQVVAEESASNVVPSAQARTRTYPAVQQTVSGARCIAPVADSIIHVRSGTGAVPAAVEAGSQAAEQRNSFLYSEKHGPPAIGRDSSPAHNLQITPLAPLPHGARSHTLGLAAACSPPVPQRTLLSGLLPQRVPSPHALHAAAGLEASCTHNVRPINPDVTARAAISARNSNLLGNLPLAAQSALLPALWHGHAESRVLGAGTEDAGSINCLYGFGVVDHDMQRALRQDIGLLISPEEEIDEEIGRQLVEEDALQAAHVEHLEVELRAQLAALAATSNQPSTAVSDSVSHSHSPGQEQKDAEQSQVRQTFGGKVRSALCRMSLMGAHSGPANNRPTLEMTHGSSHPQATHWSVAGNGPQGSASMPGASRVSLDARGRHASACLTQRQGMISCRRSLDASDLRCVSQPGPHAGMHGTSADGAHSQREQQQQQQLTTCPDAEAGLRVVMHAHMRAAIPAASAAAEAAAPTLQLAHTPGPRSRSPGLRPHAHASAATAGSGFVAAAGSGAFLPFKPGEEEGFALNWMDEGHERWPFLDMIHTGPDEELRESVLMARLNEATTPPQPSHRKKTPLPHGRDPTHSPQTQTPSKAASGAGHSSKQGLQATSGMARCKSAPSLPGLAAKSMWRFRARKPRHTGAQQAQHAQKAVKLSARHVPHPLEHGVGVGAAMATFYAPQQQQGQQHAMQHSQQDVHHIGQASRPQQFGFASPGMDPTNASKSSRNGSLGFVPAPPAAPATSAFASAMQIDAMQNANSQQLLGKSNPLTLPTEETYLAQPPHQPSIPLLPITSLRPDLAHAQALLSAAAVEPLAWLRPGTASFHVQPWCGVVRRLEALLTRVAALECVLEERSQVAGDASLEGLFTIDIVPLFRAAYARVAADCVRLATDLQAHHARRRRLSCRCRVKRKPAVCNSVGGAAGVLGRQAASTAAGGDADAEVAGAVTGVHQLEWDGVIQGLQEGLAHALRCYWRRLRAEYTRAAWYYASHHHDHEHTQQHHTQPGEVRAMAPATEAQSQLQQSQPHVHIFDVSRVRGLMFLWSLTQGIIEAMQQLEDAVQSVLQPVPQQLSGAMAGAPAAEVRQAMKVEPGAVTDAQQKVNQSRDELLLLLQQQQQQQASAQRLLPMVSSSACSTASGARLAPAGPGPQELRGGSDGLLDASIAATAASKDSNRDVCMGCLHVKLCIIMPKRGRWLAELGQVATGHGLLLSTWDLLERTCPPLATKQGWRAAAASRRVHVWFKYWLACSLMLVATLVLVAPPDRFNLAGRSPMFGFVTAAVCMLERVEATVSKVALRIVGTVAGGIIGYLLMMSPLIATNPYALAAITTVITCLVGFQIVGPYRYAWLLSLLTVHSLVLCQYTGCCGDRGSLALVVTRVAAVVIGSSLPTLLSQLVLPWYTTDWSLEVMGDVLQDMSEMVYEMKVGWVVSFEEVQSQCFKQACAEHQYTTPPQYEHFVHEAYDAARAAGKSVTPLPVRPGHSFSKQQATALASLSKQQATAGASMESQHKRPGGDVQGAAADGTGASCTPADVVPLVPPPLQSAPVAQTDAHHTADHVVLEMQPTAAGAAAGAAAGTDSRLSSGPDGGGSSGSTAGAAGSMEADTSASAPAQGTTINTKGIGSRSGGGSNDTEAARRWFDLLESKVSSPLVAVQLSLIRDTVQWQRGLLATPPVVHLLHSCELVLLDRLAAMALVVAAPPKVTGAFSGWTYEYIVAPLHGHFEDLMDAMQALTSEVKAALCGGRRGATHARQQALLAAVRRLHIQRVRTRQVIVALRKRRHHLFMRLPEDVLPHFTHPDDAVRVYAFVYTLQKVIDKMTSLARALVSPGCNEREGTASWLK